jgi:glutathione peroxidase
MKSSKAISLGFILIVSAICADAQVNFHSFKVKNIFGDSVSLSSYAGTKLLVVNTASFCGYTNQFTKLHQLDSAYQQYGFRVIGFPSNDFGGQDPYADSTINSFCQNQYSIQFPMMSKISIIEGDTSPVYKWVQRKALNGIANVSVGWNFNKFLIDENGNWVRHFFSPTQPNDTAITKWIMSPITEIKSRRNLEKTQISVSGEGLIEIISPNNGRIKTLNVFSVSGVLVRTFTKFETTGQNSFSDISSLENGCYLAEVILESGERVRRKIVFYQ